MSNEKLSPRLAIKIFLSVCLVVILIFGYASWYLSASRKCSAKDGVLARGTYNMVCVKKAK